MSFRTVRVAIENGVATVTLGRPEARNAIDPVMNIELAEALVMLEADDSVRVIVVTGAGDAFCAGADLGAGTAAFDDDRLDAYGWDSTGAVGLPSLRPWTYRTPIIGAINGTAVGGGLTLAMAFDVRFVAEDARLRFVFPRIGLTPDGNASWLLPRMVGLSRAAELLMSGRWFTGREAETFGLASKALPAQDVLSHALVFAQDLAVGTAPHAVSAIKRLLYRHLSMDDRERAADEERELLRWAGSQPDTLEGLTALLEKRAARWSGSKQVQLPGDIDGPFPAR